jgi:hypothetical protein
MTCFVENYVGKGYWRCRYIGGRCSYVCRTKQGNKTHALWAVSWYHIVCYLISEVSHKGSRYNRVQLYEKKNMFGFSFVGRDSLDSIATRYELDCPGIESREGASFSTPVQTDPPVHSFLCTRYSGLFPEGNAAGVWH